MPLPGSFSNVAVNKQDDVSIVTGTDAGTTTNVGDHAAHHNLLGNATNATETLVAQLAGGRVFNVESPDYGAVSDTLFLDGVATSADATFTSATAAFTAADEGRSIVVLRGGASSAQDLHTQISTVTNGTTVELADAPGRSQDPARFYLTRFGDDAAASAATNQAAIDAAISDAYDADGGTVLLPGVGYLSTGTTLKRRVILSGGSLGAFRATCLHLADASNKPVVKNDQTAGNSADLVGVTSIWLDGNGGNQTDVTTTLASGYTAGNSTLSLTDASGFQQTGSVLIGTNRLLYSSKSGNTLSGVSGGSEGTTDANGSGGATVTQHRCHGVYFQPNPYNAMPESVDPGAEVFDPQNFLWRVYVKNVKADAFHFWGQSTTRIVDCWASYTTHFGFRPSYDTVMIGCVADVTGRAGFYVRNTKTSLCGCDAFYAGNIVGAEGWGFFYEGPATLETGGKPSVGCLAQDCKAEGLYVRNAQRVLFTGVLDSNGVSGTEGQYAGAKLSGATNGIYDLMAVERKQDGSNQKQQNALEIQNTAIVTAGNQIRVTHGAVTGATVGTAIKSGSDLTTGNNIYINGQGGYTNPAYATPYVPDPYVAETHQMTLTGNLSISAPANAHLGTKLRFVLIQDATGGRTMTFDAALPAVWGPALSPNAKNVIEFVYNGTAWVQTAPDPGAPINKRLLSDVSTTNTTTLQAITALDWAVLANTGYTAIYYIPFTSSATTAGLALGMTAPASPTSFGYQAQIPFAADGAGGTWLGSGTANDDKIISTGVIAGSTTYLARVECQLRNGANAGTLALKFHAEAAGTLTIKAGAMSVLYVD